MRPSKLINTASCGSIFADDFCGIEPMTLKDMKEEYDEYEEM